MSRLRGGSAGAARGAASFLTETISRVRAAGAAGQVTLRADSAFYSKTVLSTVAQFGNNFESSALIEAPPTEGELARLKDTQGRYLQPPANLAELPRPPTNQVPTNLTQGTATTASDIFVGDWSQRWTGSRTELTLQVLVERYADFGQVGIVAWWRGDAQIAHPLAINVFSGSL